MQDLYVESYKTLVEKIKDLNKWGDNLVYMYRKTQYWQDVSSFQIDFYIQYNPSQIFNKLFCGYWQTYLKFIRKSKTPRIVNSVLKEKNEFRGMAEPNFKT